MGHVSSSSGLRRITMWIALVALGAASGMARGDYVGPAVRIEAVNGSSSAYAEWADTGQDGQWVELVDESSPVDLQDEGSTSLGTVSGLKVCLHADPAVELFFAVQAGGTDTTFSITSTTVTFDAIDDPDAYATAGVTVTDGSAGGGGATATGLFNDKLYQARYNGSSVYTELVDTLSAPAESSNTGSERDPASGWNTISGAVTSIESEFKFELTARDQAGGTSTFEVVPEPATMGLLAIGGVGVLLRCRRRK